MRFLIARARPRSNTLVILKHPPLSSEMGGTNKLNMHIGADPDCLAVRGVRPEI